LKDLTPFSIGRVTNPEAGGLLAIASSIGQSPDDPWARTLKSPHPSQIEEAYDAIQRELSMLTQQLAINA